MSLALPQFLFLLPIWLLAGWRYPQLELWRPLRVLLLLLLTLLLCDPRLVWKSGGMDLWVLMDRSRSAQDLVDRLAAKGTRALHIGAFEQIVEHLEAHCRDGDLVVTMGAGPVNKIALDFLARGRARTAGGLASEAVA
jgi:hypothetical protein